MSSEEPGSSLSTWAAAGRPTEAAQLLLLSKACRYRCSSRAPAGGGCQPWHQSCTEPVVGSSGAGGTGVREATCPAWPDPQSAGRQPVCPRVTCAHGWGMRAADTGLWGQAAWAQHHGAEQQPGPAPSGAGSLRTWMLTATAFLLLAGTKKSFSRLPGALAAPVPRLHSFSQTRMFTG